MSLIFVQFKDSDDNRNEHIEQLWNIMCFVRSVPDVPMLWKLTDPFLQSIEKFWNLSERDNLLQLTFLDTNIDVTSKNPILICERCSYPVDLNKLNN
jgi:hypothetical protein